MKESFRNALTLHISCSDQKTTPRLFTKVA